VLSNYRFAAGNFALYSILKIKRMKRTELSIKIWSIYLFVLGFSMIVLPATTVGLFGYANDGELWIRFTGILSVVLALFYYQISRYHLHELFSWKVAGHLFGMVCMIAFWVAGIADKRMIGTMVVELGACLWTVFALKADKRALQLAVTSKI